MSFSKTNPSGFSVGDKLTSAQMNQIDSNVAIALDKSSAGDNFGGVVGFIGGGEINANIAGAIQATTGEAIGITAQGGLITSCGGAGGISLAGGTSEEILYADSRTKLQACEAIARSGIFAAGWTAGSPGLVGPGTGASAIQACGPLPVHHGAKLTNVRVYVHVATHTALPATMPEVQIHRWDLTAGTGVLLGDTVATAATYTAWNGTTYFDVPCNLVVETENRSNYVYWAFILDEYGTGAVAGNLYYGFQLTHSSITNMQFA